LFELALSIVGLVFSAVVSLYAIREIKRTKDSVMDIIPSLDDYIFQDEESGEWQIDARLGKMFDHVGSRMALSIKQSLFQSAGVDAKLEKGAWKAAVDDIFDSGALGQIGGLADVFSNGRLRDYCKKNPSAIKTILPMVMGLGKGKFDLKAMMGNRPQASGTSKEGDVFGLG